MVSQTAEYALHAVLFLANAGGGPAVAQDISEATGVPKGYLHKILRRLGKAGILGSQRGVGGGYVLLKPASQISVLQVIKATTGSTKANTTIADGQDPIHRLIERASGRVDDIFQSTSMQDLVETAP
ncbi:MAG: Rrf2 family transcriptional regulator [Phycisphaerales bacterium]|nr:Rrf2 family transcriptional regulator [Phycisphaerales bacterium]MCB9835601.1 Rrf2 family transcriptional regulator [Phycisphaera sp.]